MNETNQRIIIFLAAFVLLVVLLLGWPAPYRYAVLHRSMSCGEGGCTVIVRINRITGNTQWNDGRGWFPKDAPETLPADFFDKH